MSRWLASRSDLRATTRTRVEGIIANYIEPDLGRIPIGNLTRLRVQEWAAELPGSPETIRKVVNVLSGALQLAVDDGRLPANPAVGSRTKIWLRNHTFRNGWFDPAAAAIGLETLTPHELRHTAASLAVSAGANVKAVQRMLGHASASITLDVYADHFEDDLDAVAIALDDAAMKSNVAKVLPRSRFSSPVAE